MPLLPGWRGDRRRGDDGHLARERLETILGAVGDAVVELTPTGVVTSWNAGAERLYGYRSDEMVGQLASRLLAPDRRDELSSLLERLSQGQRFERLETVRIRKDRSPVAVLARLVPVRTGAGEVVGVVSVERLSPGQPSPTRAPESDRTRTHQETIVVLGRRIAAEPAAPAAFAALLEGIQGLVPADSATIYRLEAERNVLVAAASRPASSGPSAPVPRGQGVAGTAVQTGAPVVANDYPNSAYAIPAAVAAGVKAAAAVPVRITGRTVGAISVASRTAGAAFTPDALEILEGLSPIAAALLLADQRPTEPASA